jgi:hypothetical protein
MGHSLVEVANLQSRTDGTASLRRGNQLEFLLWVCALDRKWSLSEVSRSLADPQDLELQQDSVRVL